jgi:hypothetical protein
MQFSTVLWTIWGVLTGSYAIIRIYEMGLGRDEEDLVLLHEGLSNAQAEQAAIAARLNRVEPIKRKMMWVVFSMSLVVVTYYIVDMVRQFQ